MQNMQYICILFAVIFSISYSTGNYVGDPHPSSILPIALKHKLQLACRYTGDDSNGQFLDWYKDDVAVSSDKSGRYKMKNSENLVYTLTVTNFAEADAEVQKWYVKTSKDGFEQPVNCQFSKIELKPSPQGMLTNVEKEKLDGEHASVRRNQMELLQFTCLIKPEMQDYSGITWQFGENEDFAAVPQDVQTEGNVLTIKSVEKKHRGFYRCTFNDNSFTVLLRVKDRLAALWPFVGIVICVIVLVIVILIFEKHHKSNKKAATTDDDEQDHANDPLVRTKSADGENKKRAVKA